MVRRAEPTLRCAEPDVAVRSLATIFGVESDRFARALPDAAAVVEADAAAELSPRHRSRAHRSARAPTGRAEPYPLLPRHPLVCAGGVQGARSPAPACGTRRYLGAHEWACARGPIRGLRRASRRAPRRANRSVDLRSARLRSARGGATARLGPRIDCDPRSAPAERRPQSSDRPLIPTAPCRIPGDPRPTSALPRLQRSPTKASSRGAAEATARLRRRRSPTEPRAVRFGRASAR